MTIKKLTDKEEFVAKVAEKLKTTKVASTEIVNTVRDVIIDLIKHSSDKGFRIDGLGTFKVKIRAAKTGRNPKTNEEIQIPEKKTVTFQLSKTFKSDLND